MLLQSVQLKYTHNFITKKIAFVFVTYQLPHGVDGDLLQLYVLHQSLVLLVPHIVFLLMLCFLNLFLEQVDALQQRFGLLTVHLIEGLDLVPVHPHLRPTACCGGHCRY